jgi:periplasmic protein TonB
MLSDTLLDSSPTRESVLKGQHWLTTAAAAVTGFCLGWFGLPLVESLTARVLATQSLVLAAAIFFSALMLMYVYADSRHSGLRTWPWMSLTLLLNAIGFIAYLIYTATRTNDWKRATFPMAYMIEVTAIGVMVIVPLVRTQALPKASLSFIPMPAPPPASPPPTAASPRNIVQKVTLEDLEKAPTVIPKSIARLKRQPMPTAYDTGVMRSVDVLPGGQPDGVINSLIGTTAAPPPKAKPQMTKRIRQGGDVEAARLIYGPKPDYPQLARMARIQGTVQLEALIAADGTIKGLKVISGHPLLVKAAVEAVEQWRYQPTLLNGDPVEVETEIDVTFSLEQ